MFSTRSLGFFKNQHRNAGMAHERLLGWRDLVMTRWQGWGRGEEFVPRARRVRPPQETAAHRPPGSPSSRSQSAPWQSVSRALLSRLYHPALWSDSKVALFQRHSGDMVTSAVTWPEFPNTAGWPLIPCAGGLEGKDCKEQRLQVSWRRKNLASRLQRTPAPQIRHARLSVEPVPSISLDTHAWSVSLNSHDLFTPSTYSMIPGPYHDASSGLPTTNTRPHGSDGSIGHHSARLHGLPTSRPLPQHSCRLPPWLQPHSPGLSFSPCTPSQWPRGGVSALLAPWGPSRHLSTIRLSVAPAFSCRHCPLCPQLTWYVLPALLCRPSGTPGCFQQTETHDFPLEFQI